MVNHPASQNDIFVRNRTYPDAHAIFTLLPEPVEKVKNECIVVVDTNVLLLPYSASPKSLEEIQCVYKQLVSERRLVIPGQVAREFADNRPLKLSELFKQINDKKSVIPTLKTEYPLLDSLPDFAVIRELEQEFGAWRKKYLEAMGAIADKIKSWTWNDPVSLMYHSLFSSDVICDLQIDEIEIKNDLTYHKQHKLPPGYKDSSKDDEGIGDLLIWHTILEIGRTSKAHLIFVSGDEKGDWYHRSDKKPLYPRYELVDEYRRASDGKSLFLSKKVLRHFW